jgi:DNA-binding NarL/FixJ family response regulator
MSASDVKTSKLTARVVVVDDHPVVRVGMSQLINHEPDMTVCGEADGAERAMQLVEEHRPDVAIVDIRLNDGDGLELTRHIVEHYPDTKVLVVSGYDETAYAEEALHAGAVGYIEKLEAIDLLIQGIRHVLSGEVFLSAHISDRVLRHAAEGSDVSTIAPVERLSPRESQIFELMGQGHTTRQIAEKLGISTKTVETYRDNIKSKMGISNVNELIRRAVETLYRRRG